MNHCFCRSRSNGFKAIRLEPPTRRGVFFGLDIQPELRIFVAGGREYEARYASVGVLRQLDGIHYRPGEGQGHQRQHDEEARTDEKLGSMAAPASEPQFAKTLRDAYNRGSWQGHRR